MIAVPVWCLAGRGVDACMDRLESRFAQWVELAGLGLVQALVSGPGG